MAAGSGRRDFDFLSFISMIFLVFSAFPAAQPMIMQDMRVREANGPFTIFLKHILALSLSFFYKRTMRYFEVHTLRPEIRCDGVRVQYDVLYFRSWLAVQYRSGVCRDAVTWL